MSEDLRNLIPFVSEDLYASTRLSICGNNSIGKFIAPFVPVKGLSGRVKLFGTDGLHATDNLSQPGTTIRSGVVTNGINPISYDLLSNRYAEAAEIPVDLLRDCYTDGYCDEDAIGSLMDQALDDAVSRIMTSHNMRTVALATTASNYLTGYHFDTATLAGITPWSATTGRPVSDIADLVSNLLMRYAPSRGNAMVIGSSIYAKLQGNQELSTRYTQNTPALTTDLLGAIFGLKEVYVADDSVYNPITGQFEKIFPTNGILLFTKEQSQRDCPDYMENKVGRTKFSSFYTYVPRCQEYPGGVEITNPDYISQTHSMRSNVLAYFQPTNVGALASGLQATALFINNVSV